VNAELTREVCVLVKGSRSPLERVVERWSEARGTRTH
jgi:hypothetical protein